MADKSDGCSRRPSGGTRSRREIGELPLAAMQVKLLRAIQERAIARWDACRDPVDDAHPSLATRIRPRRRWRRGIPPGPTFRISVITLRAAVARAPRGHPRCWPSPHLAARGPGGRGAGRLSPRRRRGAAGLRFPGNVRELENLLERACALMRGRGDRCRRPRGGGLHGFSLRRRGRSARCIAGDPGRPGDGGPDEVERPWHHPRPRADALEPVGGRAQPRWHDLLRPASYRLQKWEWTTGAGCGPPLVRRAGWWDVGAWASGNDVMNSTILHHGARRRHWFLSPALRRGGNSLLVDCGLSRAQGDRARWRFPPPTAWRSISRSRALGAGAPTSRHRPQAACHGRSLPASGADPVQRPSGTPVAHGARRRLRGGGDRDSALIERYWAVDAHPCATVRKWHLVYRSPDASYRIRPACRPYPSARTSVRALRRGVARAASWCSRRSRGAARATAAGAVLPWRARRAGAGYSPAIASTRIAATGVRVAGGRRARAERRRHGDRARPSASDVSGSCSTSSEDILHRQRCDQGACRRLGRVADLPRFAAGAALHRTPLPRVAAVLGRRGACSRACRAPAAVLHDQLVAIDSRLPRIIARTCAGSHAAASLRW